jgi:hypothetical protein
MPTTARELAESLEPALSRAECRRFSQPAFISLASSA